MAGKAPKSRAADRHGIQHCRLRGARARVGWWADNAFDTTPVYILIGLALGVLGAIVSSVMQFRTYMKD